MTPDAEFIRSRDTRVDKIADGVQGFQIRDDRAHRSCFLGWKEGFGVFIELRLDFLPRHGVFEASLVMFLDPVNSSARRGFDNDVPAELRPWRRIGISHRVQLFRRELALRKLR